MNRLLLSLFLFFCCSMIASAQRSPWKMDFYLGATAYVGDLADRPLYTENWRPAVGLGLQYHWRAPLYIGTHLFHGRLSGDDQYFTTSDWPSGDRRMRFTTSFTQWNLFLEYHPLESANRERARKISPYLSLGGGLVFYEPRPNYGFTRNPELEEAILLDEAADYPPVGALGEIGLGVDWRIWDNWSVGLNLTANRTTTDFLDGISQSGNPARNDWYSKLGLRVQHQFFAEPDRDRDGVADSEDVCPDVAGPAHFQGCPDTDGDGRHDGEDLCPLVPGPYALRGCPDQDQDGIADKDDLCPLEYGPIHRGGCPVEDRDGDGIEDDLDKCPDHFGPWEREGCPAIDSDQDGILDEDDRCPTQFGLAIFHGCPDTDGDGIEDSRDDCPEQFGVYTNNGCPEVVLPAVEAADLNREVLLFDSGSADIPRFRLLDRLTDFMQSNPSYRLTITGFTDGEGDLRQNEQLSRSRARACYRYLVQQGVDRERISYLGQGQDPTANRDTYAKGEAQSRRVEFFLYQ